MGEVKESGHVSLQEALQAQRALRTAAGLGEETFPVSAFVGMISDEIEALRNQGQTDEDIAALIESGSGIRLTANEMREYYASPEQRHAHEG